MSLYFDPSQVIGFGIAGQQTASYMAEAIESSFKGKSSLIYNQQTKTFTVLNSKEIDVESIQQVFSKYKYDGWEPKVESFPNRDKTIKLIMIPGPKVDGMSFVSPDGYHIS